MNTKFTERRIYQIILDTIKDEQISFYRITKDTGIPLSTLYNLRNRKGIYLITLIRICDYLNITIELHRGKVQAGRKKLQRLISTPPIIEVGGLLWSLTLLSGPRGVANPTNGFNYYIPDDAVAEAADQGLRLPSEKECKLFCARTTHAWAEQEGLPGMLFIDKENGNSIFFPAIGYLSFPMKAFLLDGSDGFYWSLPVGCATQVHQLQFDSKGVRHLISNNADGHPVRCLLDEGLKI